MSTQYIFFWIYSVSSHLAFVCIHLRCFVAAKETRAGDYTEIQIECVFPERVVIISFMSTRLNQAQNTGLLHMYNIKLI